MLIHNADITGSLTINGIPFNTGSFSGSFTGTIEGVSATASYVEYTNVANKPTLVSGSSQISYPDLSNIPAGIVSGSSQVTYSGLTGIPSGIVSGSAQVDFAGISNKPTLVSGSSQISFNGIIDKPTLVSGSSQITYSGLTGIPSGIVSGSAQIAGLGYATTSSNTFIGNQTITGSVFGTGSLTIDGCITATGQIVAQTINVQQVTSSIVYSCGSNVFGTSLSNTQQFTGSMFITGSNLNANVGSACFAGNVYVGGGLVAQQASTFCDTVGLFGASPQLYIGATNGASDYTILKWCTTDKSLNIHNQSTGGSTQLVIACNGNVGIKTIAAPNYDLEVRGNIGVISSTSAGLITTSTLCAAGTVTGLVRFDGLHTPSLTTYTGPSINACKDDANYSTSLVFKTTDGSGSNNVNLRITGAGIACFACQVCAPAAIFSGCVGIGVMSPSGRLQVNTSTAGANALQLGVASQEQYVFETGISGVTNGALVIKDSVTPFTYLTLRGGNVGIGTTSIQSKLTIYEGDIRLYKNHIENNTDTWKANINFTDEIDRLGARITGERTAWDGAPMGLGFDTGGVNTVTRRMTITSTGIACFACQVCAPVAIFSGCVGIGTTTTSRKLEVVISDSTAYSTSSLGNVLGIGNICPSTNSYSGIIFYAEPTSGNAGISSINNIVVGSGNSDLAFSTRGSSVLAERMRITSGGNIGIGTCAPNEKLTVWTSSTTGLQTALRLNNPFGFDNANTGAQIVFSQDRSIAEDLKQGIIAVGQQDPGTSATSFMSFYTNNTGLGERLRITSVGRVGVLTNDPKGLFEVGMTCAKTTFGGLLFNTLSVDDSNWFCFFEPPGNWAGLMTMHWVSPSDFNRSGAAQIRWSYQACSADLGPTTSIFNDSQNATATFRYAGGWLQACIGGVGAGYNVQFTIMGARGA